MQGGGRPEANNDHKATQDTCFDLVSHWASVAHSASQSYTNIGTFFKPISANFVFVYTHNKQENLAACVVYCAEGAPK